MLLAMRSIILKFLLVVAVTTRVTSRQITVNDGDSGYHSNHDYTSDFAGDEASSGGGDDGDVGPIDFSPFFSSGFSGGSNSPAGGFFLQTANSEAQPFTLPQNNGGSVFPGELETSATNTKDTGFTSPNVKFQSFFDEAAGAESQTAGFRAKDFLKKSQNQDDGATEGNAPINFFANVEDDFGSSYSKPSVKTSDKYASVSQGKSSYPSPSTYQYRPQSEAQSKPVYKNKPAATTQKKTSQTYPAKSTATYNPSGPYLSKQGYKAPSAGSPQYSVSEDHESKSGFPKKASEFHATKIGRPLNYASSASAPKSSYPAPQIYYQKFGLRSGDSDEYDASPSKYSSFVSDDGLPSPSDPYTPSEYGKDFEHHLAEAAVKTEIQKKPTQPDLRHCRRIQKKLSQDDFKTGRVRRDAMTCYVCDDPKTGGTYEKCSYESDPDEKSQSYFHGHAKTFSTDKGTKPTSYRYRRDLSDYTFGDNQYADYDSQYTYSEPLVRITRQNEPDSYGKQYGTSFDDYISKYVSPTESKYNYEPEEYVPDTTLVDEAEYKASSTNNAENKDCKTVVKGTMTCTVCQNPKTGGNSEQCSYATDPKENNYFVARQSTFNTGKKKPDQKQTFQRSTGKPKSSNYETSEDKQEEPSSRVPYEFSTESSVIVSRRGSHKGPVDLSSYQYPSDRRSDETQTQSKTVSPDKSYDDYFKELFPELSARSEHQESKNVERSDRDYSRPSRKEFSDRSGEEYQEAPARKTKEKPRPKYHGKPVADYQEYVQEYAGEPTNRQERKNDEAESEEKYKAAIPDYFVDTEPKRDLEKVLGEFSQKDRSNCKKVLRDRMTCYQCVDKSGMQHEECMFVAASEPKSQHLAYHEVKEFRLVPDPKTPGNNATVHTPDSSRSPSLDASRAAPLTQTKTDATHTDKTADSAVSQTHDVKRTVTAVKPIDQTLKRKTFFKKDLTQKTTTTTTTPKPLPKPVTPKRPLHVIRRPVKAIPTIPTPTSTKATITTTSASLNRGKKSPIVEAIKTTTPLTRKVRASDPQDEDEEASDETEVTQSGRHRDGPQRESPRSDRYLKDRDSFRHVDKKEDYSSRHGPRPYEYSKKDAPKRSQSEKDIDRDGYYTAETRQVFDPVLKTYLPEFMLQKSEHEAIFDEVLASGK